MIRGTGKFLPNGELDTAIVIEVRTRANFVPAMHAYSALVGFVVFLFGFVVF